jgi:endonuclease G, mitochondrial
VGRIAFALAIAGLLSFATAEQSLAQQSLALENCPQLSESAERRLIEEHLFGGAPSGDDLLVRRPYVAAYDAEHRVPRWVAWHAIPEYRNPPTRSGRWATFHGDDDVTRPVVSDDYLGLLGSRRNIARGHLAPHFISGGDRDGDGRRAARDIDDACTVFEINLMSNIAPQFHNRLNGAGGLWGGLESRLRTRLRRGQSFHLIAGTIFGDDPDLVGPDHDIAVPDMFFQIVITEDEEVVPFLFAHPTKLGQAGCLLRQQLQACITTIDEIEQLSGLDFFGGFVAGDVAQLQAPDGAANWQTILARRTP